MNRFINDTAKIDIHCEISYYPTGTGNDFAREVKNTNAQTLYPITAYLKDLPMVEILKGQEITVAFDEPRPPQIDGKTIFNISSYTASVPKGREETLC